MTDVDCDALTTILVTNVAEAAGEDRPDWPLPGADNLVVEFYDPAAVVQPKVEHTRQIAGVGLGPEKHHEAPHA